MKAHEVGESVHRSEGEAILGVVDFLAARAVAYGKFPTTAHLEVARLVVIAQTALDHAMRHALGNLETELRRLTLALWSARESGAATALFLQEFAADAQAAARRLRRTHSMAADCSYGP